MLVERICSDVHNVKNIDRVAKIEDNLNVPVRLNFPNYQSIIIQKLFSKKMISPSNRF